MVNTLAKRMAVGVWSAELGSADGGDESENRQNCRISQKRRAATTLAQWSAAGVAS